MTVPIPPDEHRHPATKQLVQWFEFNHLPMRTLRRDVSMMVSDLVDELVPRLPDGPELSAGLRHLLEAKDCFVRAAITQEKAEYEVDQADAARDDA